MVDSGGDRADDEDEEEAAETDTPTLLFLSALPIWKVDGAPFESADDRIMAAWMIGL